MKATGSYLGGVGTRASRQRRREVVGKGFFTQGGWPRLQPHPSFGLAMLKWSHLAVVYLLRQYTAQQSDWLKCSRVFYWLANTSSVVGHTQAMIPMLWLKFTEPRQAESQFLQLPLRLLCNHREMTALGRQH